MNNRIVCNITRLSRLATRLLLAFAFSNGFQCSIDDENRCAGDFVWNEAFRACECPDGTSWTGSGNDCEGKSDLPQGRSDAEDSGSSDTGEESELGLGEPCEDDNDCADFIANICAPVPSGRYCTRDCDTAEDCGDGYQCCDCTESQVVPPGKACSRDTDVDLAESIGGCTCE